MDKDYGALRNPILLASSLRNAKKGRQAVALNYL